MTAQNLARRGLRTVQGEGSGGQRPTDEQIIDAVRRGDDLVAGELYDRLVGVVDRTLYRIFGRREPNHEDLVQATFEQIVLTLSRRSYARACSLSTWAASIASHVGLNGLRSRRRERKWLELAPDELPHAPSSTDVEREVAARSELARIRDHLTQLKPQQAEVVFLHDVLGHELAEIALMTGVSVAAAQSRLVRGRRQLFRGLGYETKRRKKMGAPK